MFYVLDEQNNKIEAFDKEGVLNAIETAIANGSLASLLADAGFISKLKCCVTGGTNKVAFVTQAKYNELGATDALLDNCLYIITDETTSEDINASLIEIAKYINGEERVPKAKEALVADNYTRVYSVNMAYVESVDSYGNVMGEYGNVAFNWYTNKDIEPTFEAVMDDILSKKENISNIVGETEKEATIPCNGCIVEGNFLVNDHERVLKLQPIINVKLRVVVTAPSTILPSMVLRYVGFDYLDKSSAAKAVDLDQLTITVTKLN